MSTTSANYWTARLENDSSADHELDRTPVYRDAPLELTNDTTWHVLLIAIGVIGVVLFWWKNSYAGWAATSADVAAIILIGMTVAGIWRADRLRFGK